MQLEVKAFRMSFNNHPIFLLKKAIYDEHPNVDFLDEHEIFKGCMYDLFVFNIWPR